MENTEGTAGARGGPQAAGTMPGAGDDALGLLIADHERVQALFERFAQESAPQQKQALAREVCQELKIHAQIEEEIFYPEARRAIDDGELVDEAVQEHAEAKDLIAEIEAAGHDAAEVDGRMHELRSAIEHHVAEEEGELFPQVRAGGVDLLALGERLAERKRQLKTSGL
jgi:hemerythrin superfamily protein